VTLPPNVSIYSSAHAQSFLNAKLFTRLSTTVKDPASLASALGGDCKSFCVQHKESLIIFNASDLDAHHEHFRAVCLKLKEADLGVDYGGCVFDAGSILAAGFQVDTLSDGAVSKFYLLGVVAGGC
jgi:hypothetical protein